MNKILLRVAIYLRLSNEDREKKELEDVSESIKNQRNMLLDYIRKNDNFVLVGEYSDEDLSGAGTFRPEFERLIKDCEDGKIDVVLCKSQSRFSRDMEIIERYINNKFKEWNVRFIGLSDYADSFNDGNKKSRQINGLVNEWFLEDVSNNIRSAFKSKMMHGEFISPFAPFGYEVSKENNNKLVIDPVASEVVRNIYDLYLIGLGYTSIAKYLNNKNIASPSLYKYRKNIKLNVVSNKKRENIKWNASAIKTILKNEVYLGHLIQGKRTTVSYKNHKIINKDKDSWIKYKNTHEAIIDEETFKKVQIAMLERTKPMSKSKTVHIFSGKVFCMECDSYMRKKCTKSHEYLVCSNNHNENDYCENKHSIRYDELTKIVLEKINEILKKYYDIKKIDYITLKNIRNKLIKKIESLNMERLEIQKKINNTKNYLKNIYEDKVNGVITIDEFKDLIISYKKNNNAYKKKIVFLNKEISYYKKNEALKNNNDILNKYQSFDNLNRVIVEEFIDKIYIGKLNTKTKCRDVQIKWKF